MKIVIVFMAILILNISFLTYQGDMGRYLRAQNTVKAITEECGAGAALFFQTPKFAEGYLVAETNEAQKYIAYILSSSQPFLALANKREVHCEAIFFDDSLQSKTYMNGSLIRIIPFTFPHNYLDDQGHEITIKEPSVIVSITLNTQDFFRLPFLSVTEISRSAMYELKSKNN